MCKHLQKPRGGQPAKTEERFRSVRYMNQLPFLCKCHWSGHSRRRVKGQRDQNRDQGSSAVLIPQGKRFAVCKCWADTVSWNISVSKRHQNMSRSHFSEKSNERNQILNEMLHLCKQNKSRICFSVSILFPGLVSCKTRVQCWSDISLMAISVALSWCFVAVWPLRSCSWVVVGQWWH